METFLSIIQIINAATPGAIRLVGMLVQKPDGTFDAISVLSQAEAQVKTNIDQIAAWMSAHPKG